MLKFGYISELDVPSGLVRVFFEDDGITSNPLPVSVQASKTDKYSFPFVINEHVWCLMDENCEFGVVGGAVYSAKDKPSSHVAEQFINVDIGATKLQLKIDRQAGNLELKLEGDAKIEAQGNIEITAVGNTKVKGENVLVEAVTEAKVKAPTVKVEAATIAEVTTTLLKITAPTTTMSGILNVTGVVAAGGFAGFSGGSAGGVMEVQNGMKVTGTAEIDDVKAGDYMSKSGGAMQASQGLDTPADVTASGKSLTLHMHTDSQGGSTTPPI